MKRIDEKIIRISAVIVLILYIGSYAFLGFFMRRFGDIEVSLIGWHIPLAISYFGIKIIIISFLAFGNWNKKK